MRHGCCEWWRLISGAIGVIASFSMFFMFFLVWGNYAAGTWSFFSGVTAAINFHLTYLHIRDMLEMWHNVETLRGITLLGVMISLAGGAGFVWYIFVGLYYQIPLLPMSDSAFITSVWAAMTVKYGLMLIFTTHIYIREIYRETPPLLSV